MSDQPQHTNTQPPNLPHLSDWEARAVFRETYLHLYPEAHIRDSFRRVGITLYDNALLHEETYRERGEVPVKSDLRAALEDLRQLQGYLHHLGAEPGSVDDAEVVQFQSLAIEVSEQLAAQASRLEEKLGTPPDLER